MSDRLQREVERARALFSERHDLMKVGLERDQLDADPMLLFERWFEHARAIGVEMPETMTLATVSAEGLPSVRNVSMRGRDAEAFHFYTHYESTKGRGLHANPHAAVLFNWLSLRRQIKLTGRVLRAPAELSDAYFRAIPRPVRLRFIASQQSRVIRDRAEFEETLARVEAEHVDRDVPRPENYGAFRLIPDVMEFWQQGYRNFLGDRFRYRRLSADEVADRGDVQHAGDLQDAADVQRSGTSAAASSRWKIECLAP